MPYTEVNPWRVPMINSPEIFMTFRIVLALVISLLSIEGRTAEYSYGTLTNFDTNQLGSYVQWTEDVAVTVNHIKVDDSLFALECVDIQFIPRKGMPPVWDNVGWDDEVIAVGDTISTESKQPRLVHGRSKGKTVSAVVPMCDGDVTTRVHTATATPGMSGGPLYRVSDGAAVGINVGTIMVKGHPFEGATQFIQTSVIRGVWDFLQKKQADSAKQAKSIQPTNL